MTFKTLTIPSNLDLLSNRLYIPFLQIMDWQSWPYFLSLLLLKNRLYIENRSVSIRSTYVHQPYLIKFRAYLTNEFCDPLALRPTSHSLVLFPQHTPRILREYRFPSADSFHTFVDFGSATPGMSSTWFRYRIIDKIGKTWAQNLIGELYCIYRGADVARIRKYAKL